MSEGGVGGAGLTRLNWGCGDHVAPGWINSDNKEDPHVDLVADIRQGLPLETDSVDYAVSVHALPELPYPELVPALQELWRVLAPGGVLRLVLPDLDRAIDAYRDGRGDYFKVPDDEVKSAGGRFIVHSLWYGYTRSLFTTEFAAELLARAGFESVCPCAHGHTHGPFGGIVELDNREDESLYIEARKPRPTRTQRRRSQAAKTGARADIAILGVTPDPGRGVMAHFAATTQPGASSVAVVGWAVGLRARAVGVQIVADGAAAATADIGLERPDVAAAYPSLPGVGASGFHLELLAAGRGESRLELYATLEDGTREPLGMIVVGSGREPVAEDAGGVVVALDSGDRVRAGHAAG